MTARAYYNENDKFAAAWLRELIKRDLIADGDVDERSIADVSSGDLAGYTQCHFFAGIGGWSYALRLAGWADDQPVWTGSCPCQPFSSAGKGDGANDPRHLWPSWFRLINERRPDAIFGEQVASTDGFAWIDLVLHDLERSDYAGAAVDLPSCSVNTPFRGGRLYFVAQTTSGGVQTKNLSERSRRQAISTSKHDGFDSWRTYDRYLCADGRVRPIESSTQPMAHGIPAFMGRLRGYGNAIVPQVAAAFIGVYMEITQEPTA